MSATHACDCECCFPAIYCMDCDDATGEVTLRSITPEPDEWTGAAGDVIVTGVTCPISAAEVSGLVVPALQAYLSAMGGIDMCAFDALQIKACDSEFGDTYLVSDQVVIPV